MTNLKATFFNKHGPLKLTTCAELRKKTNAAFTKYDANSTILSKPMRNNFYNTLVFKH